MLTPNINLKNKTVLVTGAAGFIGANLVEALLRAEDGVRIVGIDNLNDYYDISLKEHRLSKIEEASKKNTTSSWEFIKGSISDRELIDSLFEKYGFSAVVNLAAQAGVRHSITNPDTYIESNIIGFYNILDACRQHPVEHLVYASSSSVYGTNEKIPYSTDDKTDTPVSLYAATKKSNELMAHAYSKLYDIPSTGLRFFTVYGPCGRPDMAYFSFTDKILRGEKIQIFNYGDCKRDFTYISDVVDAITRVLITPPEKRIGTDSLPIPPYRIYNVGNSSPENLSDFVNILCDELILAELLPRDYDLSSHKILLPMQRGDIAVTYSDTSALVRDFGFKPSTPLRDGLRKFVEWYRDFYSQNEKI